MSRLSALACLALAIAAAAPAASAQTVPASSGSPAGTSDPMQHMDHGGMPGMDMPDADTHADGMAPAQQAPNGHHNMPMQHAMTGQHHSATHEPAMPPSAAGATPPHAMAMPSMQGGSPPPDARDPDYSDGVGMGAMHGIAMAMEDDPAFALLRVDQLEAFHGEDGHGQRWEIEGGYGDNRDKLWLRTEGERAGGKLDEADVELLWQHAVAAFWDTQLGVRADTGEGPDRHWAAFGIQGLAPYWFELEATLYAGPQGRTAARVRADYELLFTQRLVLQPELEVNAYGKADPARSLGSGVSDASLGLRLRYEIRRQFAPYVGVVWTRRFGATADFAHQAGQTRAECRWVAGVRLWF